MKRFAPKASPFVQMANILAAGGLIAIILIPAISGRPEDPVSGSEISTQENAPSFRIQVQRDLVQIRVVVRDAKGRALGNLTKDDFRLTDNGKPQIISHFAVEIPGAGAPAAPHPTDVDPDLAAEDQPVALPDRYIALYFDDVHSEFGDLARTREAGEKYLASQLRPGDRVGIFTSSGQNQLDFTDDLGKLHETLRRLLPRPIVPELHRECPQISGYQGYLIVHRQDPRALEVAVAEALECDPNVTALSAVASEAEILRAATTSAEINARHAVNSYQTRTDYALRGLDGVIRQMGGLPGQRTLVLVSPGFLMLTAELQVSRLIDRALRSNVVVNALDAKGLSAPIALGDASKPSNLPFRNAALVGMKSRIEIEHANMLSDVMHSIAHDTGGVFFTNSNDLDQGFRRVGALPEVYYTLAFSPQNMKFNGSFHKIKVTLAQKSKFEVQARNGYFAPEKPTDPTAQEKEEIAQAIFSQAEVREFPVNIQTQFFKVSETQARLAILAHLDLGVLRFRKENDRNMNNLVIVTVLFDRNGKYLDGKEKRLQFRLRDLTYAELLGKGITSKTSFDVIPGTYTIRLVVRDSEGAQLSALNRRVDIPL